MSFSGAAPNPARGALHFHFSLPEDAEPDLRIFDAGGRLVARLEPGRLPAGRHTLAWDGRTAGGARAGTGVYFARFRALGESFTERFSIVR